MAPFSNYSGSDTHIRIDDDVTSIPDRAFEGNEKLVEVELPAGLQMIGRNAFFGCRALKRINLCEGLQRIGDSAFCGCSSLLQVNIPSTVSTIEESTFYGCKSLAVVHLCEGLCSLGDSAFQNCHSLKKIYVPSSVSKIGNRTFQGCLSLKEVKLCEGLRYIRFLAMFQCISLLSLNIPSSVDFIAVKVFDEYFDEYSDEQLHLPLLRNIVISPSSTLENETLEEVFQNFKEVGCTFEMLKRRFDGLPLHKVCFYHSHQLMDSIDQWTSTDFSVADCLGMMPLHVLACSGTHDLSLYRRICEICPNALIAKDKWGEFPLGYIILAEAPKEILHFFLESHCRENEGSLILPCFVQVIKRLVMFTSGEYMRHVIQAQRTFFPALEIDWECIAFDDNDMHEQYRPQPQVVRVLVEASLSLRSVRLSLEHEIDIEHAIRKRFHLRIQHGMDRIDSESAIPGMPLITDIRQMIIDYAQQLVEKTTILELALWKVMLNDAIQLNPNITLTDQESRNNIRTAGGKMLYVVIPNVLSFL